MGENCISLANAIEQMKELDDRLKVLEAKQTTSSMDSVADRESSDDEQLLPEIRARVSNEIILLKIQCEKRKGVLVKVLVELDRLDLDVASASIVSFGSLVLDITITAQMENKGSIVPMNIVVSALRACLVAGPP